MKINMRTVEDRNKLCSFSIVSVWFSHRDDGRFNFEKIRIDMSMNCMNTHQNFNKKIGDK